jgi:hypothetical protein
MFEPDSTSMETGIRHPTIGNETAIGQEMEENAKQGQLGQIVCQLCHFKSRVTNIPE